jgi:iron(II)-dependent oxidoreductase
MNGLNAPDEKYERIFDPIKTPREESKNLPSREQMESYLTKVRERVLRYLEKAEFDDANPMLRDGYVFHLVLQHEYQHQETLLYLFQLLSIDKKIKPALNQNFQSTIRIPHSTIEIPAGDFEMGCAWRVFGYDNEFPVHTVHVPAFKIDRFLTTNEEFARFVDEGGYRRREFWSEEGWTWLEKENCQHPLYWTKDGDDWREQTMFEETALRLDHPVIGVSWHEAEAYANFIGKRLPTEAEWEKAASWGKEEKKKNLFAFGNEEPSNERCNFNAKRWTTTPVGHFSESANGFFDMTGNAWEWTSDIFDGFEGFQPFPYPEYSQEWFDGDHRILKGGSWATRAPLLRTSFRNFFRRHFRIAFAGIRLASDL